MKSALVFLALVAITQGVPHLRAFEGRVVNGEDASVGEIPYQVSLQTLYSTHFCGGSILNKNYVITVAHCVKGMLARYMKVFAGTTNLERPQSVHFVAKIIFHADYNPADSYVNDIALVKVSNEFDFSETISSVPLPEKSAEVTAGSVGVVSGWGSLAEGGARPMKLQRTDIVITDQNYCNEVYYPMGYPIYETHICSSFKTVETGPCRGDSGGPLTVDGTLVGLVSWVKICATREYPTVYTRVSEYIDWIESHAV